VADGGYLSRKLGGGVKRWRLKEKRLSLGGRRKRGEKRFGSVSAGLLAGNGGAGAIKQTLLPRGSNNRRTRTRAPVGWRGRRRISIAQNWAGGGDLRRGPVYGQREKQWKGNGQRLCEKTANWLYVNQRRES